MGSGVRIGGTIAATFVATLVFAASASAEIFIFNAGPGGTLNGINVSATGTPACAIAPYCPAEERGLGEKGFVVGGGPYDDCAHTFHYHGDLFGGEADFRLPDPAPNGCGWGPVIEYASTPPEVQKVSDAITAEARAATSKDEKEIKQHLKDAISALRGLPPGPLVNKAIKFDQQTKDAVADGKFKKATKKLEKAVDAKQAYFDSFFLMPLR